MKCLVAFIILVGVVKSENILGLFPFCAKSHFAVFNTLMIELARRGHNVTVVSPFNSSKPLQNYKQISVHLLNKPCIECNSFDQFRGVPEPLLGEAKFFIANIENNNNILTSSDVRRLVNREEFDLVFVEMFSDDVFLLFANQFNAPIIGFASCYPFPWSLSSFAAPQNPSYIPNFYSDFGKVMDLNGRIFNTVLALVELVFYKFVLRPLSVGVIEQHFGKSEGSLALSKQNVSLFLLNTYWSYHNVRPYPPQVVEVGGLHVQPSRPIAQIYQDLDRWINESTHGVVYFSFGSMLRGATLPVDKVQAFLQVFRLLPQRILWKWEDDAVDGLPNNVKVMKWLPQRDILAHPNVKAFISHGGLLGTTEAVVSGVPILGIPMYGDQPNNVAALVENGVAVHVDYNNISVASLSYALNALLNDKSYRENAAQLARRFLDRPMSPLDTAVYWTEYVIRHGGAPHLRSAAVSLAWYQYYLLDVVAVCLAALIALIAVIYYSLRTFLRILCTPKPTKLKSS